MRYTCDGFCSSRGFLAESLSSSPPTALWGGPLTYTVFVLLCCPSRLAYEYMLNPRTANVQPTTILKAHQHSCCTFWRHCLHSAL